MNVLMFHDVVNDSMTTSGFTKAGASQYRMDEARFISVVEEACSLDPDIVLSFDDGGSSFYHVIAPILERYGKRGVFFISTAYIGTPGFMTADEIRELDRRGHLIASHSHTHPKIISKLPAEAIEEEWRLSKEILQSVTGHEIDSASVPGGAVSKKVLDIMGNVGYSTIYTSSPDPKVRNRGSFREIGRYTVTHTSDPQYIRRLLTDSSYRLSLRLRYKFLRGCKLLLGSRYNSIKQTILKGLRR